MQVNENQNLPHSESRVSSIARTTRIVHSGLSGHTLFVRNISATEIPDLQYAESYTTFYEVRNFDVEGIVMLYLGKGSPQAPREIVAWYPKTRAMWNGYGLTLKDAIEDAQRDGWLYA